MIKAGHRLVEENLVARTWGNVSCRVGRNTFMITPSGKPYEGLGLNDIVAVNLDDLSFEGSLQPSSETKVHAAVYRRRPDVNFIIHTHQLNASALSLLASDLDFDQPGLKEEFGEKIWSVPYALSGSTALMKNVETVLGRHQGKAYLLTGHGALCLGKDSEEAFRVALMMEEQCLKHMLRCNFNLSGQETFAEKEFARFYQDRFSVTKQKRPQSPEGFAGSSIFSEGKIIFYPRKPGFVDGANDAKDEENSLVLSAELEGRGPLGPGLRAAWLVHRAIYKKHLGINAVIHTKRADILNYSSTGKTLYPMIDDFAQIIGLSARPATLDYSQPQKAARLIVSKLSGRRAVLLQGAGALCLGPSFKEAQAAELVLEKNCRAAIAVDLCGQGRPLKWHQSVLMRYIYLHHYAKKAEQ